MDEIKTNWRQDQFCLQSFGLDLPTLASAIYERTCRTNFDSPGFCLLRVGTSLDSQGFRRLMVDLKNQMSVLHESKSGNCLAYLSAARFDQQTTTKPHLDGGPDECFLMLGYEPSEVLSELNIIDYARCAFELGLSPKVFMAKYNPMFKTGFEILQPYSTRITCFDSRDFQILCINNSSAPYSTSRTAWQGTLHTATIPFPDDSKRRVINSTMIASVPKGTPDIVSTNEIEVFINSTSVRRSGYDKPHLKDDK